MLSPPDVTVGTRQALRRLARAVVVITTQHRCQRFAMSATAVSELSMSPPLMLVCINRSASIYSPLKAGALFGINILHASHESISRSCSGALKGEARFDVGCWLQSTEGVPYLRDAQATLICAQETSLDYGSHCIFIGRVSEAVYQEEVNPLIYANGRYGCLAAQCEALSDVSK
jgi:flavin reductase (DIM6/NTAB) family NADH-FMN oxidoreductase RutF